MLNLNFSFVIKSILTLGLDSNNKGDFWDCSNEKESKDHAG